MEDDVHGIDEEVQDWEKTDFLVDSGATMIVIGEDRVEAVAASKPDPNPSHKLADGGTIHTRATRSS